LVLGCVLVAKKILDHEINQSFCSFCFDGNEVAGLENVGFRAKFQLVYVKIQKRKRKVNVGRFLGSLDAD
jgi:hypothetical protein